MPVVQIRCGEKEALLATLQFFEEKYERLGELEYYQERRLKGLGLLDDDGGSVLFQPINTMTRLHLPSWRDSGYSIMK